MPRQRIRRNRLSCSDWSKHQPSQMCGVARQHFADLALFLQESGGILEDLGRPGSPPPSRVGCLDVGRQKRQVLQRCCLLFGRAAERLGEQLGVSLSAFPRPSCRWRRRRSGVDDAGEALQEFRVFIGEFRGHDPGGEGRRALVGDILGGDQHLAPSSSSVRSAPDPRRSRHRYRRDCSWRRSRLRNGEDLHASFSLRPSDSDQRQELIVVGGNGAAASFCPSGR